MDPLNMLVALGPLSVYLMVIGWLNLKRRATIVTGGRDTLAMGIAMAGFILVGPLQLFMPTDAAALFGSLVWLLLISFYCLAIAFVVLNERNRIVIYNLSVEQLKEALARLAPQLDPMVRSAGDTLALASLGIELRIESTIPLHNVSLVANNDRQSLRGWKLLTAEMARELAQLEVKPNWQGLGLVLLALMMMGLSLFSAASDPAGVAQSAIQLLRL